MAKTPASCPNCSEKFDSRRLYTRHVEGKKCKRKMDDNLGEDENIKKSRADKVIDGGDTMLNEDPALVADNSVKYFDSDKVVDPEESDKFAIPFSDPEQDKEPESNDTDEDEEVQVVKANIFKFQGELTYEQQLSQDILHYEYFDDFNDDNEDIIILDDDDPEKDEITGEEGVVEETNTSVCCEECGKVFDAADMEDHKQVKHPPKKKNFKQFNGGNFFMIAE